MSRKAVFIAANGIGLVVLLLLAMTNSAGVPVHIFSAEVPASSGMLMVISYVVGAGLAIVSGIPLVRGMQDTNVAKLKEWQSEDQKLALELQSDREKQLEKKIDTLEAALKQALKR